MKCDNTLPTNSTIKLQLLNVRLPVNKKKHHPGMKTSWAFTSKPNSIDIDKIKEKMTTGRGSWDRAIQGGWLSVWLRLYIWDL